VVKTILEIAATEIVGKTRSKIVKNRNFEKGFVISYCAETGWAV
jgi:hypothetical protein